MDCSLPDSSVHGILQARILEWAAISFSRGSSRSRDRTQVSCITDSLPTKLCGKPLTARPPGMFFWMFLMTSRTVNPFQEIFSLLCPDPSEESLCMAAIALWNVFLTLNNKTWNYSLISELQNGCCVSRHENNINLVHLHQRSLGWLFKKQYYFERNLFFLSSKSQQWDLKYSVNHVVTRCAVI